ncbi:YbaN family protein [Weissella tructae]|jgi:hypothetical protein|uniref:YbaN protein n=2 Tax=Weissella TaxID=46255 RepID=A0A075TXJ5_9LACO|nr:MULTISPECIES: YbaN family protein [Weissella]AIG65031.1 hypothetical protein WS08_0092 [Weissella tructae]AIM62343.1 hypothetical protein WS74_0091 [Weissella ceti]AIM63682.1 hypothetical protein WS105_0092 [Weissella ceti]ELA07776.1 hypothetical protein WCNC_00807 [Weissella ceti NC36]QVV91435.1 DUF454 family protein [Weissella tructae]
MRYLYILFGCIAFGIGTAAIWIPGIPTTGFYVLAAFCWTRSSPRLLAWLKANKYYQEYVVQGVYHRELSQNKRIMIYIFSAAFMAIPFFLVPKLWLRVVLIGCSLSQIISMEGFYRGWFMNNWFRNH